MVKAAEFNPDVVLLSQKKDGTFLPKQQEEVFVELKTESSVLNHGTYTHMDGQSRTLTYLEDTGKDYFVGEGDVIQSDKVNLVDVELRSEKIARNIIVSDEYLKFTWANFFEDVKPLIVQTFKKEIDRAVIFGTSNSDTKSINAITKELENEVLGDINYETVVAAFDNVYESGKEPTVVISTTRNNASLRGVLDPAGNQLYDNRLNDLDGVPVDKNGLTPKGDLYVGDFSEVYYGIPSDIEFKVLTEATLTEGNGEVFGEPIRLGERDLIALQVTMHFASEIGDKTAFSKITPDVEEEEEE